METIDAFKQQQRKTIMILERVQNFIQEAKEFGVQIDPKFLNKVRNAISQKEDEKLKIALVGGFSEGKTSIVAAWSEKYDEGKMKISQSESSDEVEIFPFEEFELIDTPGLFGFKESSNKEKYMDKTKKYVSETNILLYVMNPNNPIKESHKEELRWLFKDLALLSRTVFVLGRFDEEADIEDEEEYQEQLRIKKDNIKQRLIDFKVIDATADLSIVAVSANPFDQGFDYWLQHMDEFKKISHIGDLQKATTKKIEEVGNKNELVLESQKSIINDILGREIPLAEQRVASVNKEFQRFNEAYLDIKEDIGKTNKKIAATKTNLREYITDFFTDLILQVQGTDIETFKDFFQRNIGDGGIVLENKIQNELERQVGTMSNEIGKMEMSYNASFEHYQSVVSGLALEGVKRGSTFLKTGKLNVTNASVLTVRDFVMPSLKFKPWQAVKWAKTANTIIGGVGAGLGIAIELWDSWSKKKQQEEFSKAILEVKENFEKQRKEYLDIINDEDSFLSHFFPSYEELERKVEMMGKEKQDKEDFNQRFQKWCREAEIIEGEFERIS